MKLGLGVLQNFSGDSLQELLYDSCFNTGPAACKTVITASYYFNRYSANLTSQLFVWTTRGKL